MMVVLSSFLFRKHSYSLCVCARVGDVTFKKIVCLCQGLQEYYYLHIYFLILLIKKIFFWLLSVTDVIY